MTSVRLRARLCLIVLVAVVAGLPSQASAVSSGSFTHETPAYAIALTWSSNTDGTVFSGTLAAAGRLATVRQTIRTGAWTGNTRPAIPVVVRSSSIGSENGNPTVTIHLASAVAEVSGTVVLTFLERNVVQRSEFHVPSGAFAPTVEATTRVDWQTGFGAKGSVDEAGKISTDDGAALDPYGEWEDSHRYGVFLNDPAGAFVGHARIKQGSMANYLTDGRIRVGPTHSEIKTYFNGFLDAPSAGLAQGLWAIDALSFLPDGSTPGAYIDLLKSFPGFEAFQPPHPGDLTAQPNVVIAVADTGINPYHEDFRNPAFTQHPSTYLSGYPASTPALQLTVGSDYAAARNADDAAVWSKVVPEKLYWIPGTKIVGAISIGSAPSDLLDLSPAFPPRPIIDDNGHGTGSTSVAAGYRHGSCEHCLIVAIEGSDQGVAWAASQPWIDMISNSYGPAASLPVGSSHTASRLAFRAGKSVLYSAGNGMSGLGLLPDRNPSFTRPTSGPSWVVTVGAASPKNDQDHYWHGVPADVISYGSNYPAAAGFSVTGQQTFSGTSCATPITAGVEGALLRHARQLLGDLVEGTSATEIASGSPTASGPLADGTLTRAELEAVLLKTAIPTQFDPAGGIDATTVPGSPAGFVSEGYGLVNRRSLAAGLMVVEGSAPLPDRPVEDTWIATTDRARDAIWGRP